MAKEAAAACLIRKTLRDLDGGRVLLAVEDHTYAMKAPQLAERVWMITLERERVRDKMEQIGRRRAEILAACAQRAAHARVPRRVLLAAHFRAISAWLHFAASVMGFAVKDFEAARANVVMALRVDPPAHGRLGENRLARPTAGQHQMPPRLLLWRSLNRLR